VRNPPGRKPENSPIVSHQTRLANAVSSSFGAEMVNQQSLLAWALLNLIGVKDVTIARFVGSVDASIFYFRFSI
jgi:hypothetical protein